MPNRAGSPTRQIFYTHVMKTGGTSLNRVLRSHFDAASSYPSDEPGRAPVATKTFAALLLGLDEPARRRIGFFSVHQPAWVAWEVAPASCKITVLRDPIARTISHLRQLVASPHTPDDVESIYRDEGWRGRLANYQTQIFADTEARHASAPPAAPVDAEALDEQQRAAFEDGLVKLWGTAIERPMAVGPEEYERAISMLDRYDCVGITEDLPDMRRRLAERTGLELGAVPSTNVGRHTHTISPALLERITSDNEYDLRLYAHAATRAGAAEGPG